MFFCDPSWGEFLFLSEPVIKLLAKPFLHRFIEDFCNKMVYFSSGTVKSLLYFSPVDNPHQTLSSVWSFRTSRTKLRNSSKPQSIAAFSLLSTQPAAKQLSLPSGLILTFYGSFQGAVLFPPLSFYQGRALQQLATHARSQRWSWDQWDSLKAEMVLRKRGS